VPVSFAGLKPDDVAGADLLNRSTVAGRVHNRP
jgi:hypothetical protein